MLSAAGAKRIPNAYKLCDVYASSSNTYAMHFCDNRESELAGPSAHWRGRSLIGLIHLPLSLIIVPGQGGQIA